MMKFRPFALASAFVHVGLVIQTSLKEWPRYSGGQAFSAAQ